MLALATALLLLSSQDTVRTRRDSATTDSLRAARAQQLETVQVTAVRARAAAVSAKTITRPELQRTYVGQETPILLQATPNVTAYSESGSGSNYSYIRLRGIDQTRLNITLDGIPLNEPEDQSLYFSNFPDFANSISSVQVQRGVGSSTFGVASYAGSVNFESIPVAGVAGGGEAQLTLGEFNTKRGSLIYQTGLQPSGLAGYIRGSAQETDGYRFNSGNRSRSVFGSGGWFGARDIVKLSLLAGLSSNDQAYYASPVSVLASTPRDNPFGNLPKDEVTDRFHQDLVSLAWTHSISEQATFGTTLYGFDAGGWYDYPGDNGLADAYHYRLHSRWGGAISSLNWQGDNTTAAIGANVSRYSREHWLTQRPDVDTRYYDNTGHKSEGSVFAKGSWSSGNLQVSGDVQWRNVTFRYDPTAGTTLTPVSTSWNFLNPKVGATLQVSTTSSAYITLGMNGREPTRADMFAGADDVDTATARSVFPLTRVRPERVYDLEAGMRWASATLHLQGNAFYMRFHDEIAAVGAISELGYELRKNVDRSSRMGVEGDMMWQFSRDLTFVADAAITRARIADYHDDGSNQSYHDVAPLMTPVVVSNHGIRGALTSWLTLDANGRYVSRMMLTNTNDARFTIPASWYSDLGLTARGGNTSVLLLMRNVFDARVYTGGYPDTSPSGQPEPAYYLMAPRNVALNLRLTF